MRSSSRWMAVAAAVAAAVVMLIASTSAPAGAAPQRKPRPTPSPTATSAALGLAPGSVSPATITGGDSAVQTIRLTAPAPAGGIDVSISASDVVYTASAGFSVYVPAGETSVSFPFRLSAPETTTVRSLWAQIWGTPLTKVAEVMVLAADPSKRAVTALRFDPDAVVTGGSTTGTVTLNNPAPAGGVSVSLWSNTSYGPGIYVPPYVVVEEGQTSVTFTALRASASVPAVIHPSADIGSSLVSAPLVLVPDTFALGGGVLRPGSTGEGAVGIGTAANPDGITVALASGTPGVSVPATVTIPAGRPGVAFPITVAASVPLGSSPTITATWNGTSVTTMYYIS